MNEDKKIILVGKHITEYEDEIADGYVQVELDIEETLDEIGYDVLKNYAVNKLDLRDNDDLEDVSEDDLVSELSDRSYDFCGGADDEKLIELLDLRGYKIFDEYDKEYFEYLKIATLDVQDMYMLK